MAYLDLTADYPFAVAGVVPAPVQRLGSQERLVVLLSRTDPLWSLRPRHTHSRFLNLLFGIEAPHQLADRRLETLRNYAVTYRLRDETLLEAESVALKSGFAANQLAQVRQMVDGARAVRKARDVGGFVRQALFALVAFLILSSAAAWISPRFDSSLIAFVFVAVGVLSFASFAGGEPVRR